MTRFVVVGLIAALAACGAGQKRTCDTSIANRASGLYAQQTRDQAEVREDTYVGACRDACIDLYEKQIDNEDVTAEQLRAHRWCLETELLAGDANPLAGAATLAPICNEGAGPALACEWVEAHRDVVATLRDEEALRQAEEAKRKAAEVANPVASNTAGDPEERRRAELHQVALQIANEESSMGFEPVADQTINAVQGGASHEVMVYAGLVYHLYVLGDGSSSFAATLLSGEFHPIELGVRSGYGVYVRGASVDPTAAGITGRARLSISGQSGVRRIFRILIFKPR